MSVKSYIVRRTVDGDDGSVEAYIRVWKPEPGETFYHGNFKPVVLKLAMIEANNVNGFEAVGDVTSEVYTEGLETFGADTANVYIVRRQVRLPKGKKTVDAYVKVPKPEIGETYYLGVFRPVTLELAMIEANNVNGYEPMGEVTAEVYTKGIVTF